MSQNIRHIRQRLEISDACVVNVYHLGRRQERMRAREGEIKRIDMRSLIRKSAPNEVRE